MEPPFKKFALQEDDKSGSDFDSKEEKSKGWCRQKFREEWCNEPVFFGWLEAVPEDMFRAWCKCCQCTLSVGRSELLKHAQTQKHKRAMYDLQNPSKVLSVLESSAAKGFAVALPMAAGVVAPTLRAADEGVMTADLRLSAFAVEHNLSADAVDHLSELVMSLAERPEVFTKIKMSKEKCCAIVKNVLARSICSDLDEVLKSNLYSIILEEPLLVDEQQVLCFVVRYFNQVKSRIRSELLEAFAVGRGEASPENVCAILKERLTRRKIPLHNLIGFAADRGSVLFTNGVDIIKQELFGDTDESAAVVYHCTYQSMTAVAQAALNAFPPSLDQLMNYFGNFVIGNMKHYLETEEYHSMQSLASRKIFLNADTATWLINPVCLNDLIVQLPFLTALLERDILEGRIAGSETLLKEVTSPYAKAYYMFLNYVIVHFYSMEQQFKSDQNAIHQLLKECQAQFRLLCQHFMRTTAFMVEDLTQVDPYNEENLLPLKDVFVGFECQEYLKSLEPEQNLSFLMQCQKYLQVSVAEIQARLPLADPILDQLFFLDPDIALKDEGRSAISYLDELGNKFSKFINRTKLSEQWLLLPNYYSSSDLEELKKLPLDTMWGIISDMRNKNDELVFSELGKLAKLTLSLPIANHEVVTVTSALKKIFAAKENGGVKLDRILDTILPLHLTMTQNGSECHRLRITNKHRKFYALDIYKREEFSEEVDLFVAPDD